MKPIELAGCIILDHYGRMLLLHRNDGDHSQWEMPGGKLEDYETAEEAAVRELQEELGVGVRLTGSLGSETFERNENNYKYNWFQAVIASGTPHVVETDIFDDFDYFELEDMPSLALSENMLILYPKIYSGEISVDFQPLDS